MTDKPMIKSLAVALGLALAGSAWAWNEGGGEQDEAIQLKGDRERGREVYEVCSACHLPEGWGTKDGTFPQLAGQHPKVLIKQLADIRARNRDNPTMYPFALPESIGDAQALADVVAYIETIPMNPDPGLGPWGPASAEYVKGEQLYKDNCVRCHGEKGEGIPEKLYPRIGGQHYLYLVRQFEWIRDGKRRNANPDMVKQIQEFSDEDEKLVLNWVARQLAPKTMLAPSADWYNPDFK